MKFFWQCGNTIRYAIAFWCVMISRRVIDDIGLLDDLFGRNYNIERLQATRMINCNAEKRGIIKEILVMNY